MKIKFGLKHLLILLFLVRAAAHVALLPAWADVMARRTNNRVGDLTPASVGLDYRDVTLTSADGTTLVGWYIPSQNGAVIIVLHGHSAHRGVMLEHARILARHGYGVLLYDLRAHGDSGGDQFTYGWADVQDVAATLEFLRAQPNVDPGRIGLFGFSLGGQIALRATAQFPDIQAVIADGPGLVDHRDLPPPHTWFERWQVLQERLWFKCLEKRIEQRAPTPIVQLIGEIAPRPLLLIATGADDGPEYRLARHLYEQANEPKMLWRIVDASHGEGLEKHPQDYEQTMIDFFDHTLEKTKH
ncbi:MAG: alpha/beta fold hydrolase [Anaerolineae bacterium]|nr:alpha/beta fold hydrolase [Anaerolineae bacterium]